VVTGDLSAIKRNRIPVTPEHSGGARILEQVGPAAGPEVVW